jgi:hypothetical protein
MWQQDIQTLNGKCGFSRPALQKDITAAEEALGVQLPDELGSLLFESNGVVGEYGVGIIWPIERIQSDNLRFRHSADFRELYMPFDHLLFFADAGNSDQFAFAIHNTVVRESDVFTWDHENDSRTWAAPSLKKYLEWWLTGVIKL